MRRFLPRIFLIFFTCVVLFLGWAAWYAQDKGFTHSWRNLVQAEFEKRGMYATIERLNLDPLRGLIAKDVQLYEDPEHQILLMSISRIALDVDITRLFSKELALKSFEIRDADLSIPLDPKRRLKGEQLALDHLNASIQMPADRVEIVHAQAEIKGIEVVLKGSLQRPSGETVNPNPERSLAEEQEERLRMIRDRRTTIAGILHHLESLDFKKEASPRLELQVYGDLKHPEELRGTGSLRSGALTYRGFDCEKVEANFDFAGERLTVRELFIQDRFGELQGRLEYDLNGTELPFTFKSGIDLPRLLGSATREPKLSEVVFYQPPQIEAEGVYYLDQSLALDNLPLKLVAQLRSGRLTAHGVIFDSLTMDVSLDGDRMFLRNARLVHKTGTLSGDALRTAENFRFRAECRMDPTITKPFMRDEHTRQFLSSWSFDERSDIYLSLEGEGRDIRPSTWQSTGEIDLRACKLNGHPISQLKSKLEIDGLVIHFRDLAISRPEGGATGRHIELDHARGLCTFHDVSGKVFPVHAVGWFNTGTANRLRVYDFHSPPHISVEGVMDLRADRKKVKTGSRHDYVVTFQTDGVAEYEFLGTDLLLQHPKATVRVKEDTVTLDDLEAGALGGNVFVDLRFDSIYNDPRYQLILGAQDIQFQELARHYSLVSDTEGRMDASFQAEGHIGGLKEMKAVGAATIENGNVFSIPLFGPLSKPVAENLPKLHNEFSVARDASLTFSIEDGIFATSDLRARTNAFQVNGAGEVDLNTNEIDFAATINFRGAPGVVLKPLSELLAYRGTGSLADPVWRPANLPHLKDKPIEEFSRVPLQMLRTTGERIENQAKQIFDRDEDGKPMDDLQKVPQGLIRKTFEQLNRIGRELTDKDKRETKD